MKNMFICFIFGIFLIGCENKSLPTNSPNPSSPKADNTAVNTRDKNNIEKTPIDQNENKADIDITAKIRREVIAAKLSINAQNAKIITQNGEVTLRGPVKTAEEKQKIEDIARSVAGNDKVVSQLEIEPTP